MEMNFTLSVAQPEDRFQIAPLIYEAIGDIAFRLTGEKEEQKMLKKLETLVALDNNRHSYLNTYVAKASDKIIGMVVIYDGKTGYHLDRQLEKVIYEQSGVQINIDVEAHEDEFYIDTLCVLNEMRGHGIGSALLNFAEQEGKRRGFKLLSLNVEVQKSKARALYEKLGFVTMEPWTIINEPFLHMVKQI